MTATPRSIRPLLLAAGLIGLLAAQPALAQPTGGPPADPADRKQAARAAAEEGTRRYNLGQFESALESYTRAYELVPAPGLLFNIGQCHRGLRNHERAIFFFEGYLREKPDAGNRDLVEELIAEERTRLERKRALEDAEAERRRQAAEAARQEEQRRQDEAAQQNAALTGAAPGGPRDAAPADRDDSLVTRWWFWTTIGVVVAAGAGTAIYFGTRDTILPQGTLGTLDERMR